MFIFFLAIVLFVLTNVASLILIPTPLGLLPRGVSSAFGITLTVFCAIAALHSLHLLFRLDTVGINGKRDGFPPSSQQHYSTLV
jgi:hypothetical protein